MFISDMFSEDYPGGAELITEAFIRSMPNTHVVAKFTAPGTPEIIDANNDAFIVCNFAALEDSSKIHM